MAFAGEEVDVVAFEATATSWPVSTCRTLSLFWYSTRTCVLGAQTILKVVHTIFFRSFNLLYKCETVCEHVVGRNFPRSLLVKVKWISLGRLGRLHLLRS